MDANEHTEQLEHNKNVFYEVHGSAWRHVRYEDWPENLLRARIAHTNNDFEAYALGRIVERRQQHRQA